MSKKSWALVALLVLIGSLMLVACTGGTETVVEVTRVVTETEVVEQEPEVVEVTRVVETDPEEVEVTRVVEVEVDPNAEEEASRTGGWLDTIVIVQEPDSNSAVARLEAGDLHMYADDIAGEAAIQPRSPTPSRPAPSTVSLTNCCSTSPRARTKLSSTRSSTRRSAWR